MKIWIFIPLLVILLCGFAVMSIILIQGLEVIKQITIDFINFLRSLIL